MWGFKKMIKTKIPSLIPKYKSMIKYYGHSDEKFGIRGITSEDLIISVKALDVALRDAIGKTDDINISLCSHQAILSREFPEHFCRVCNKDLSVVGVGRINDYLVLRHPNCRKPICLECAKTNPDDFYKAFDRGLKKLRGEC